MEAVPRLHMLWFALKTSPEGTSFANLKRFIAGNYKENAENFSKDVHALEVLRNTAMRPAKDVQGCATLKRYYCQLSSILNRFPQITEVPVFTFTWKDLYQSHVNEVTDLRYEMAAVLFNIAASHTQVGASVSRGDVDGMKLACTHFQCAAWSFGELKEKYAGVNSNGDFMTPELLVFMQQVSFAQAQECILEKSLIDNRKPNIVAKVTAQIVTYYGAALAALFTGGDDGPIAQVIDSSEYKLWKKYVKFKIAYLNCILFLYQGQHAEEQQKMGERLTLYQAAWEKLEEARKESKGLPDQKEIIESLTFTADVVEGKRKNAKNENEFIYHEAVPELSDITAVQGANLVNGIGFSVIDPDVAGEDIFARLVPLKAHEASSMYSEEKAKMLREIGAKIETADVELASYMSSLTLDNLNVSEEKANKIPQGIVDRCASLNANKAAIPDLIASMSHLAEICAEVETNLNEMKAILSEEELNEKQFAQTSGVQRPNGHLAELTREFQKYSEAHQKAGESNDTLRKAMELHVNNLKILSKPLQEIQSSVPKLTGEFNSAEVFKDLKLILNKVNEMKAQRAQFHADLRIAVNNDDITTKVIAHGINEGLQALYATELKKHDKQVELIETNLNAQTNILAALTEAYAKAAPLLKTLSDVKHKKDNFFSSLAASFDVYEDLLGKSAKGLEFYKKLSANVQKLLARVRAAKDVQDEDRQQRMKSNAAAAAAASAAAAAAASSAVSNFNVPLTTNSVKTGATPKLKDYLKGKASSDSSSPYIPSIRPNPLGSENPTAATCGTASSVAAASTANNQNYPSQVVGPNEPPPPYSVNQYYEPTGYSNALYHNTPAPPYEPQAYYQQQSYGSDNYQQQAQAPSSANLYQQYPSQNLPQTANYNQQQPTPQVASQTSSFSQYPLQNQPTPAVGASQQDSYSSYLTQTGPTERPPAYQAYQQQPLAPTTTASQSYPAYQPQQSASPAPTVSQSSYQPLPNNPLLYSPYSQPAASIQQTQSANPYESQSQNADANASDSQFYQYTNLTQTFQDLSLQQQQQPQYPSQPVPAAQGTTQPAYNAMAVSQAGNKSYSYSNHPGYGYNASSGTYEYGSGYQIVPTTTFYGQYTNAVGQVGSANSFTTDSSTTSKISARDQDLPVVSHTKPNDPPQTNPPEQPSSSSDPNKNVSSYYTLPYGYQSNNQTSENPFGYQPVDSLKHSTPMYTPAQATIYMQSGQTNATQTTTSDNYGPGATPPPTASVTPTPSAASVTPQPGPAAAPPAEPTKKPTSNIDLLTDIDFSSPVLPPPSLQPLIASTIPPTKPENSPTEPLTPTKQKDPLSIPQSTIIPSSSPPVGMLDSPIERKMSCDNLSICSDVSSLDHNVDWDNCSIRSDGSGVKSSPPQDPFVDPKTLKYFHKEVERFEKTIETLNVQMLNGSTPLKSKWKEIQELLKKDSPKKTTAIAKLFPEKNRSNDCIPYDHARVVLEKCTDDYINAAYVKDLGPGCPNFIIAQTPQQNTQNDFWSMIWSQKARTLVCLHTPNEILDPFWPQILQSEMHFDDFSLKLVKINNLSHTNEFALKLSMNGADAIIDLSLLQIKAWTKSSPPQLLGIAHNVLMANKQRCDEFKTNAPVIMNCLTGSERSEQIAVAMCAIQATQTKRPLLINVVDVWYRICNQRQNALKDTESLELSMQIILSHAHDVLNKRGIMTSYQMKTAQTATVKDKEEVKDPLNELDPLWKLKQK